MKKMIKKLFVLCLIFAMVIPTNVSGWQSVVSSGNIVSIMIRKMYKPAVIFCVFMICFAMQGCHSKESEGTSDDFDKVTSEELIYAGAENAVNKIKDDTQTEEMIWVTDQEISWTEENEKLLREYMQEQGWLLPEKVTFLGIEPDSMIDELKNWDEAVESGEYNRSVAFISVHDEVLAQKLKDEDLLFYYFDMSNPEEYPTGNLNDFAPCEQARIFLGEYVGYSTMTQASNTRQIDIPLIMYFYEEVAEILIK